MCIKIQDGVNLDTRRTRAPKAGYPRGREQQRRGGKQLDTGPGVAAEEVGGRVLLGLLSLITIIS